MDSRVLKTDTACALHGSRACAILNARSCETCPVSRRDKDGEKEQTVADYLDLFESLLPEGGTAQLFESKTCTLCKKDPKGARTAYAIVDFGHSEPKELQYRKLFQKGRVGFLLPLQFGCCTACRRRLLLLSYLPLLAPLLLCALIAPALAVPHWTEALRAAAPWLPLLLAVVALGGGYALGRVLQKVLQKRFARVMYVDFLTHPVSRAAIKKGWFPLFGEKRPQPVFTKKRIRYGLGNAASAAYAVQNAERVENAD